jgi:hypothetical protein
MAHSGMTTRRTVLGLAGAAFLGACTRPEPRPAAAAAAEPLLVSTVDGLVVVNSATGAAASSTPARLATTDGTRLVGTRAVASATEVTVLATRSGQVIFAGTSGGRLDARVVSSDGRLVALVDGPPGPRTRTTVVVVDSGGERFRYDLPGNLEPEAFSVLGGQLYVLDYLPPAAPDRYRVRALDLATGTTRRLNTRDKLPVPAGAEEEMRGQGRQAVYDPTRRILFTLYTHQPDHQHTRDLLAARPGSHVHAFVHSLNLDQGWAYCIDLPEPFGESPAAAHAIARGGHWLYVVDGQSGRVARIDPEALTVLGVLGVGPVPGDAALGATRDGGLVIAAGRQVLAVPADPGSRLTRHEYATATPTRGVAVSPDNRHAYVGQDGAVVPLDLTTGAAGAPVPVAGLVAVRSVLPS